MLADEAIGGLLPGQVQVEDGQLAALELNRNGAVENSIGCTTACLMGSANKKTALNSRATDQNLFTAHPLIGGMAMMESVTGT